MLLEEDERKRVKGVIINKFRGNVDYFKDAMKQLEDIIKIPVLGVLPYFSLDIEDEDSVTERIKNKAIKGLDIAVIRLPHMSNFTDFNPLEIMEDVTLRYVENLEDIKEPDIIILPGTKNTINDLREIKLRGIFDKINELKEKGTIIFGICGGYQMLGKNVIDINGIEGEVTSEKGFGFLDIETIFDEEKRTKQMIGTIQSTGKLLNGFNGTNVTGYEIHNGVTKVFTKDCIFIKGSNEEILGVHNEEGNVFGTYLHGIFDETNFLNQFVNSIRKYKGHVICEREIINYREYKLSQYDELVKLFEDNINMKRII